MAVDDLSLLVDEGEIFGFLGPNGAGKSTTMMILTTLLKPTSGRALVAGYDVVDQPGDVRRNIGYVQQETAVDEFMTGRENLLFVARINHLPRDESSSRIDDVLELVELSDRQNDPVVTYSGGMRKRLDIASGLLHMPKVLFLDEPTVGLDIQTRRKIWDHLRSIHKRYDITIFVSTHYMEEADRLCDRVAIIDYGKVQDVGSPSSMKDALGKQVISLNVGEDTEAGELAFRIRSMDHVCDVRSGNGRLTVYAYGDTEIIPRIFEASDSLGLRISSFSLTQPTLEDVFLSRTGHALRDDEPAPRRQFPRRRARL